MKKGMNVETQRKDRENGFFLALLKSSLVAWASCPCEVYGMVEKATFLKLQRTQHGLEAAGEASASRRSFLYVAFPFRVGIFFQRHGITSRIPPINNCPATHHPMPAGSA
jgi:hypothetical protein